MPTINFGKYNGTDLEDLPQDYLEWLIDNKKKDLRTYEDEILRRKRVEEAQMSDLEKIVSAGYKALAKKAHPDSGGSTQEFQALGAAYEQLKMVLKEVQNVTGSNKT